MIHPTCTALSCHTRTSLLSCIPPVILLHPSSHSVYCTSCPESAMHPCMHLHSSCPESILFCLCSVRQLVVSIMSCIVLSLIRPVLYDCISPVCDPPCSESACLHSSCPKSILSSVFVCSVLFSVWLHPSCHLSVLSWIVVSALIFIRPVLRRFVSVLSLISTVLNLQPYVLSCRNKHE